MSVGKAQSLPQRGIPERCSHRWALSLLANIRPGWIGLLETNTLYYSAYSYVEKKIKCSEYGPINLSRAKHIKGSSSYKLGLKLG
jgi:hypothetical protein